MLLGLNLLLALVLALASAYLYSRYNPDLIRGFAENLVREELDDNGLEFSLNSMEIYSLHDIRARNLTLREKAKLGKLGELREIRISLSRRSLLFGSPRIAAVHIQGGTLNCPALSSPSGAQEPVLKNLRAILIPKNDQWTLRNISFDLHNAKVIGSFKEGPPIVLKTRSQEKPADLSALYKILANLLRSSEYLAKLDRPTLTLVSRKEGHLDIRLQAHGLQISELLTCDKLLLRTHALLESGHLLFTTPVDGTLNNVLFKKDIRITSLQLRLPTPSTEIKPTLYPLEVEVSTGQIQVKSELAGRFIGTLRMEDQSHLQLGGTLGFLESFIALSTKANLEKKTGYLETRFTIEPENIPRLQAFIPRDHLQKVRFKDQLGGELHAEFGEGWVLNKASFDVEADQLNILDVPVASFKARGNYKPSRLEVEEFAAEFKPGYVEGSYQQDMNTEDYRFLLIGEFLPSQLNPWFKTWWDELWAKFEFKGLPPKANIDISGRWGDLSERDIFGSGQILSATYEGTYSKRVDAKLRCIPKYTELFDIDADFPQGEATGSVSWTLHPTERSKVVSRRFDLGGALDIHTAGALFGKRVSRILDDFTIQEPPNIKAKGVLFDEDATDSLGEEFINRFTVRTQAKSTTFQAVPLDYLKFDLLSEGDTTTLDPLHFGFAEGNAKGWIKHRQNTDIPPIEFAFTLKNADKEQAFKNLSKNKKLKIKPLKTQEKKATFEHFEIHAKGYHGDLRSFEGVGEFTLNDPSLAQVNILGLLFKELKGLALPFISFSFNRMETKFQLRKHLVVFPSEGIKIKGPTSKVDADGSLDLKNRNLDMRVRFLPLGLPLAGILEMRLGGTLDEPKWNPKVNPTNLIDPKKLQENVEALDPSKRLKPEGLGIKPKNQK